MLNAHVTDAYVFGALGAVATVVAAVIAAAVSINAARQARVQAREAAEASPYEALAARVVQLEHQVGTLQASLQEQKAESARRETRFRARIDELVKHIDKMTVYAEMLIDMLRIRSKGEVVQIPDMPRLPEGLLDDDTGQS